MYYCAWRLIHINDQFLVPGFVVDQKTYLMGQSHQNAKGWKVLNDFLCLINVLNFFNCSLKGIV